MIHNDQNTNGTCLPFYKRLRKRARSHHNSYCMDPLINNQLQYTVFWLYTLNVNSIYLLNQGQQVAWGPQHRGWGWSLEVLAELLKGSVEAKDVLGKWDALKHQ